MPNTNWTGILNSPQQLQNTGGAFNTFTTGKDVGPTPILSIPANTITPGQILTLEAFGTFGTTGTPTLSLGFYLGAATVNWVSVATATATGAVTLPWYAYLKMQFRGTTTATTTPVVAAGWVHLGLTLSTMATPLPIPSVAIAATNIDTTVANNCGPWAAWGASSLSNTITTFGFEARLEN